MKIYIFLFVLLWSAGGSISAQSLVINELMASNDNAVTDPSGSHEDWFELYNPTGAPVNIGGYYVTDDLANKTKYRIPTGSSQTVVPANGFLVLWASEAPSRGPLHVNFKLSAGGEQLGLIAPDGVTVVSSLTFGTQRTDISYGRQPDGSATWVYFPTSTPGASNNSAAGFGSFLTAPVFSVAGGFYGSPVSLTISAPDPGATIYYTTDGSDPDPGNLTGSSFPFKNQYPENPGQPFGAVLYQKNFTRTYTGPLIIADSTAKANRVSAKSSTFSATPTYLPSFPVAKGTVIRAIAVKAGSLSSTVVTQTYFIRDVNARYSLPVVSISGDERNLFDYFSGIYTAGAKFDSIRMVDQTNPAVTCTQGNYSNSGDAWERRANIEYFVNYASVLNQPAGLRINGACSRSFARKSLRLYGEDDFAYRFFASRPADVFNRRLILRSGGNDWTYTLMIDPLSQTLVNHLPFGTQANRPSIVFLNGEYWGLHTLMERYDRFYLNRTYGVNADSVDLVTVSYAPELDEGDLTSYNSFVNYFVQNNPVNYETVKTMMDIENFTDYQISEIFFANTDWPYNNQALWRKKTAAYLPGAGRQDGRWRWLMKDMDFGLGYWNPVTHNTLNYASVSQSNIPLSDLINQYNRPLRRMLDLSNYRTYFINRFADLLNTTFLSSRTASVFNAFQQEYDPEMQQHFARWPIENTYSGWLSNLEIIRNFLLQRPDNVRSHIRSRFSLSSNRNLTVNVSDVAQGYVKVNTIDVLPTTPGVPASPYPWTGVYFQGVPVTVVAKPNRGYKFQHWKDGATVLTTDTTLTLPSLTANRSLMAVFAIDSAFNSKPAAYNLIACDYRFESWDAAAPAGTYPPNMHFVSLNQDDPDITATPADTVKGAYNYSSRTRINGLGSSGIALINTSPDNTNPGYVPGRLGGMLLALRTLGLNQAFVKWTGGTVTPNSRQYRIRLRYRIGDTGSFQDLTDSSGNPVEYVRNATAGHSQTFGPVALPAALLNRPYVQLLWQYYYTGVGTSGARDQLRIDDVVISRDKCESIASGSWQVKTTWTCGRVPSVCDDVVIKNGHIITVTNAEARNLQMEVNAQLSYLTGATLVLKGP